MVMQLQGTALTTRLTFHLGLKVPMSRHTSAHMRMRMGMDMLHVGTSRT